MPRAKGSSAAKRPLSQSLKSSPRTDGVFLMFYPVDRDIQTSASSVQEVQQRITEKHYVPTQIRPFENGYFVSFVGLPPHLAATMIEKLDICVQGTWYYPCNPGGPKPAPKKAKPALPQPPAHVLTTAPAEPIAAPVPAIMVPSTTESPPVARSTPPVPSPKLASEDDFSESDMIESPSDSSFTLPPSSDEEIQSVVSVQTPPRATAIPPLSGPHASHAEVRALDRPRRSTSVALQRPKPTNQEPRARRHPALQKPLPARDLLSVTILVRPRDPDTSLHKIGFKDLARALSQLSPVPTSWRRIFGHGLAIDFPQGTPEAPLLELTSFAEVRVTASLPTARRTRSGTVRGQYSSPEEVRELYSIHDSNPMLQEVERIGKSNVFRLTFADAMMPDSVIILYNTHRVTPFFTRPLRCFNCHKLNHVAKVCRSTLTCGKCTKPGHTFKDCPATKPKCPNCGGPHNSADRNCPHWQYELRIRKTVVREDIPLPQARAAAAKSYAEALKERQHLGRPANPAEPQPSQSTLSPSFSAEAFISVISKVLEICISNISTPDAIQAKVGSFLASSLGLSFTQ